MNHDLMHPLKAEFFNAAVRMQKAAVIHLITNFAKENGNNGLIQPSNRWKNALSHQTAKFQDI